MQAKARIAFVFSTKDRLEYTKQSLASLDTVPIDLIWLDGSDGAEAQKLPFEYKFKHARMLEVHTNLKGGPDVAIRFGLRRLLALGYDYCGLIENDIVFQPGWYEALQKLFVLGERDGLAVGAATVRSYESRMLEYKNGYALSWNIGAGMALFSRRATELILAEYQFPTGQQISAFYARKFRLDLRSVWELWVGKWDLTMGADWAYTMILYQHGLASLASVPTYATDLDLTPEKYMRSRYVGAAGHRLEVKPIGNTWELALLLLQSFLLRPLGWAKKLKRRRKCTLWYFHRTEERALKAVKSRIIKGGT